jgi:hypothetical protein
MSIIITFIGTTCGGVCNEKRVKVFLIPPRFLIDDGKEGM